MYILFLSVSLLVVLMSRHTHKRFEHHWLFPYRHYTNVMLWCSVANPLAGSMFRYMYLMLHYRNLHSWHRMIHRLQIMARKLKLKKLQNKSSRFVLFLAIDYLCVCVCVCRFLRVSADWAIFLFISSSPFFDVPR